MRGTHGKPPAFEDWVTPPHVVAKLHQLWPGGFFDPCTTADNPTQASNLATKEDPCEAGKGYHEVHSSVPIYMNPPWSEMERWLRKYAGTWKAPEWVVCGPAAPSNHWWSDLLVPRSEVLVTTRGRLAFVDPRTGTARKSPPCGTFFAYRGPQVLRFVELFGPLGSVLYPG